MSDETIAMGGAKQPTQPTQPTKSEQLAADNHIPTEYIDTEFQIPTDFIELPSEGVFYENKKSKVEIKYLTASEDDILYSPDLLKSGRVLDALLEVAVIDKDIRPNDMLSGDRNYLLVAIRRTGLGDDYEPGEMECNSCHEKYNPVVDLAKLSQKKLEQQPDESGEYAVQMPVMKMNIKFRFLNGNDEKRMAKMAEFSSKSTGSFKVSKMLTEKYLLQIMEVNGQRDKGYIKKYISAMPMKDSAFFREYVKRLEPGIDLNYEFECPSCGTIEERDVPINTKLFYPDMDI